MMVLFRALIDVERHVSKKNSKQSFCNPKTGRTWIKRSDKAIQAENYLTQVLQIERQRQLYNETIHGDIHVKFVFSFKDYFTKLGERNKKLPDLSNLYELPQDALQKSGVIEDDHFICSHDGSRRIPGKTNSLEIIIYTFKDE